MLDGARKRSGKEAKGDVAFVTADVMALPFEDASFDGAIMAFRCETSSTSSARCEKLDACSSPVPAS
ncbi:MAG: methyltransferase domain-containing protein [Candidatus Eremiobacteraeota bacterium]|nr:methyltransferase domain-containing protein [Candidatus Eremiobacteraeota bacterium]